jgi:hypothetical protein
MKPDKFIEKMCVWTGLTAVGPSALRCQGKDVLKATQEYLGKLDLAVIPVSTPKEYADWLNTATESLLEVLHKKIENKPWGTARKALNLFMRNVLYNRYLNDHFNLGKLEPWLEIPLDSAVAKGLKHRAGHGNLPQWPGLKKLKWDVSKEFQDFAAKHAENERIERVHLDVYLWPENR